MDWYDRKFKLKQYSTKPKREVICYDFKEKKNAFSMNILFLEEEHRTISHKMYEEYKKAQSSNHVRNIYLSPDSPQQTAK